MALAPLQVTVLPDCRHAASAGEPASTENAAASGKTDATAMIDGRPNCTRAANAGNSTFLIRAVPIASIINRFPLAAEAAGCGQTDLTRRNCLGPPGTEDR